MKYVIKNSKNSEPTLRLFLEEFDDNDVFLCGEADDGFVWQLLRIKDGEIMTVLGVDTEKTGFKVDSDGEIEIYHSDE